MQGVVRWLRGGLPMIAMAALLVGAACGDTDNAETPTPGDTEPPDPAPTPPSMNAECPEDPLLERLREEGTLRVIVTLEMDLRDTADRDERRAAVAEAQDRILAELESTGAELIRRFGNFPQLVLRVDEAALCYLLTSPLVESIHVDEADPPAE